MDAASLVAAAADVAAAFDRGGRLLAVGDGRAGADARHVAVEFLHPVIVGPPGACRQAVGAERVGPDDIVVAIGYGTAPVAAPLPTSPSPITRWPVRAMSSTSRRVTRTQPRRRRSSPTTCCGSWCTSSSAPARRRAPAPSGLDALYPMLGGGGAAADTPAAAIASTEEKLAETTVLRAHSLADNDAQLDVAARLVASDRDRVHVRQRGQCQ